ncbi:MAG: glycosyltransferase family 2 protein [Planctomycetota bacterium]|nr:glycosyltransferase family 2 protein [Planctomycetota bacterium]
MKKYSVVIPVYNESESLPQLLEELSSVATENGHEPEIIFVDDGSTDDSWQVIEQLCAISDQVQGIRLRRNFGKAAALSAGFEVVTGDVVFTLDADLQDDPREIPAFLEKLDAEQLDVISGWKKIRHDPFHKTIPSRIFNWMVGRLTGVRLHDHNCGFKCYRREVLGEIDLYGEMHRFIPVLANARGFRVDELVVEHRKRQHGVSKYGFNRFFKGFLDLLTVFFLTGYRQRPQHLLGTLGMCSFLAGGGGLLYLTAYWLVRELGQHSETMEPLHQRPLLIYSLGGLLLGAQLMSIGFIAELITSYYRRDTRPFSIRESTRPDQ